MTAIKARVSTQVMEERGRWWRLAAEGKESRARGKQSAGCRSGWLLLNAFAHWRWLQRGSITNKSTHGSNEISA